ncbi:MAG: HD domain-containing protein [Thermodesulfobacteriota bacterium]
MKTTYIKDIQDRQAVADLFLVKSMSVAETKAGKPYLNLTLMDRSGDIVGRVWEGAERLQAQCPPGALVEISGQSQSFRGQLQLNINTIKRRDEAQVEMSAFVPASPFDPEEMAAELVGLVRSVGDDHIRRLLLKFFNNDEFMAGFKRAVAAKGMHHAYLGGLLEHTLGVARLAAAVAPLYPELDRDLLLAGAMLHDIGKMKEFDFSSFPADYSDQGRLMGHMVLGVEMIEEKIGRTKDFPPELAVRLKHMILSHHGRYEFGSPTLPMVSEAFVLNFIDDMDAKLNTIAGVRAKMEETPGYQWSPYQRSLERFLFVKGHSEAGPAAAVPEEQDNQSAQAPPRLF